MTGRDGQDEVLVGQVLGVMVRGEAGVLGTDHEVDDARVEVRDQVLKQAGAERQADSGVPVAKRGHGHDQVDRPEDRRGGDPDRSPHEHRHFSHLPAGGFELGEGLLNANMEQLAGMGPGRGPHAPVQEGHPELRLELLDLRRDRRLRDPQPAGGLGEAALSDDRVEVDQLPEFHNISLRYRLDRKLVFDLSSRCAEAGGMDKRTLGSDGFTTSALGLGCTGFSQGYGPADEAESVAAIHRALDAGVMMLDTAMSYGQGHNERLIARALASRPGDREHVQLATKFGIVRDGDTTRLDAHPSRVRGYCVESLKRLQADAIDLYYLHRADPAVPVADTVAAMARLVDEGLVRHLGVCEVTPGQLAQAAAVHPITAVQFEWSLLWREAEHDIVPAARALGIGLVPYSPLGRGLLTAIIDRDSVASNAYRGADPRFQGDNLDRNLRQVEALRPAANDLRLTPGQLALAWLLAQGDDVVPIPGTRRPDRIAENAASASVRLDSDVLRQLDLAAPPGAWAGDRHSFAAPVTARRPVST